MIYLIGGHEMGTNVSIYFKNQDQDLLEWIDEKVEDGTFRNRAHAVTQCVEYTKEHGKDVTEYV